MDEYVDKFSFTVDEAKDADDIGRINSELLRVTLKLQTYELHAMLEEVERQKNPAVKDAWDKYQTVLKLTKKS